MTEKIKHLPTRKLYSRLPVSTSYMMLMSAYYVGYEADLKADEHGMLATAEDVGIFLRALNDGSLFDGEEQEIYSSIYVYEHTGWVPGYQRIAKYHEDIDTVVIQFMNTTGGFNWNTGEVVYSRIVKTRRRRFRHVAGTNPPALRQQYFLTALSFRFSFLQAHRH